MQSMGGGQPGREDASSQDGVAYRLAALDGCTQIPRTTAKFHRERCSHYLGDAAPRVKSVETNGVARVSSGGWSRPGYRLGCKLHGLATTSSDSCVRSQDRP